MFLHVDIDILSYNIILIIIKKSNRDPRYQRRYSNNQTVQYSTIDFYVHKMGITNRLNFGHTHTYSYMDIVQVIVPFMR